MLGSLTWKTMADLLPSITEQRRLRDQTLAVCSGPVGQVSLFIAARETNQIYFCLHFNVFSWPFLMFIQYVCVCVCDISEPAPIRRARAGNVAAQSAAIFNKLFCPISAFVFH